MNFELEILISGMTFRMVFFAGHRDLTETEGLWRVSSSHLGRNVGYWRLIYGGAIDAPFDIDVLSKEDGGYWNTFRGMFFTGLADRMMRLYGVPRYPLLPAGANGVCSTWEVPGAMIPANKRGTWKVTKPPDYSPMKVETPDWYKKGGTGRARI